MAAVQTKLAGASRLERAAYTFGRALVVTFCRIWLGMRVEGAEHVPTSGPFILAPTHRSNMDILLACGVTRRRLRYMGKDSLWKFRPIGRMLSMLGGFPVTRGTADLEALKRCVAVLRAGEPLVLFPEGTRRSGPTIDRLFDGAAFVAAKAGVPIVPVGIAGAEDSMPKGQRRIRRSRCVVLVGRPLTVETASAGRASRGELETATENLRVRLQELLDRSTDMVRARQAR